MFEDFFRWAALLSAGFFGLVAVLLYTKQRALIYPANVPEGSREVVAKPSDFGMNVFEEVSIKSADGTSLHAYYIPASERSLAGKAYSILYCHVRKLCVMITLLLFELG